MATVGYGDVVPVNAAETGYVIACMILGAVVFGYVVGTVGVAATNLSAPSLRHSIRMQELVDYLHERKVSGDLFARTCTQYNFYLTRKSAFDEDIILGELTDSLRQEVCVCCERHFGVCRPLSPACTCCCLPPLPPIGHTYDGSP